jgi:hypothetical protein
VAPIIPEPLYCGLRRRVDLWTLFGRVTDAAGNAVVGARVDAVDADLTQDDALGGAVTNARGVYRIDYPGDAFRKGTRINVELIGGPDVYFKVTNASGKVLLDEPSSTGRSKGRQDISCSERINLTVPGGEPPPGQAK